MKVLFPRYWAGSTAVLRGTGNGKDRKFNSSCRANGCKKSTSWEPLNQECKVKKRISFSCSTSFSGGCQNPKPRAETRNPESSLHFQMLQLTWPEHEHIRDLALAGSSATWILARVLKPSEQRTVELSITWGTKSKMQRLYFKTHRSPSRRWEVITTRDCTKLPVPSSYCILILLLCLFFWMTPCQALFFCISVSAPASPTPPPCPFSCAMESRGLEIRNVWVCILALVTLVSFLTEYIFFLFLGLN